MALKVHTEKLYGQEAILENVKVKQGLTFTDTYYAKPFIHCKFIIYENTFQVQK